MGNEEVAGAHGARRRLATRGAEKVSERREVQWGGGETSMTLAYT